MLYTAESVSPRHPDKVCDIISDAILDECLKQDVNSRVAIETMGGHGIITVTGELTTEAYVDVPKIVKDIVGDKIGVQVNIVKQSPEISRGVDKGGAGDQGCLKKGTLVNTNCGWKKIEEVEIGNLVATTKGYKKVYNVQKTGELSTVTLITNKGRKLTLTPDHLVKVPLKNDNGELKKSKWFEANDMLNKDFFNFDTTNSCEKHSANTKIPDNYNGGLLKNKSEKIILTENLAYLFGFLIGDGSINNDNSICFAVKKEDKKNSIKKYWKNCFNEELKDYDNGLTCYSICYREAFDKLGLLKRKSHRKEIPWSILQSNPKIQASFLRGWFDADGSFIKIERENRKNDTFKLRISSVSEDLVQQGFLLLQGLGIDCSITDQGTAVGVKNSSGITSRHKCWNLNIVGGNSLYQFNRLIGFDVKYKEDKLSNFLETYKIIYTSIKKEFIVKIESDSAYEVYDLSIEEFPEFFANGVCVHNCMTGYACRENKEMIPQELYLARSLCKFIYDKYPEDGKTQVTLSCGEISHIVASFNNVEEDCLRELISQWYLSGDFKIMPTVQIYANPAGDWSIGSFEADTGLTGRKIVVDNYGPRVPVGGGCYSSKDATKVDRTGAYYARYLAIKYLKENQDCNEVTVKIAFVIGLELPVMVAYETKHGIIDGGNEDYITVEEMIALLDLRKPIFKATAEWGAYGSPKSHNFRWNS